MITTLSKCLTVLATVASLGFLALVSLSAVGGVNFEGQLDEPEYSDFIFTKSTDETTGEVRWKAETRLERYQEPGNRASAFGKQVAAENAKVLPAVMIKALQMTQRYQQADLAELDQKIKDLKQRISDAEQSIQADRTALEKRIEGLIAALARKNQQLAETVRTINETKGNDLKKRQEAERRRIDIERLNNQIGILRADRERLLAQQQKLLVLLEELRGTVRLLQQRRNVLQQELKRNGLPPGNNTPPQP